VRFLLRFRLVSFELLGLGLGDHLVRLAGRGSGKVLRVVFGLCRLDLAGSKLRPALSVPSGHSFVVSSVVFVSLISVEVVEQKVGIGMVLDQVAGHVLLLVHLEFDALRLLRNVSVLVLWHKVGVVILAVKIGFLGFSQGPWFV
jgi:hypothetical protein